MTISKLVADADAALADVQDGARIMFGGFGLSGNAENCIAARARRRVADLTVIADGKDERAFSDRDGTPRRMILETALTADFACIRAKTADEYGNLRFYRTSRNFSPMMAMAAKVTVVEAEEIVPRGSIDPDE